MSTPIITPPNPAPPIDINTPAPAIAAANTASQVTETPGQPRNADVTFAPPVAAAPAVVTPTAENPVVTRDLGEGKFQVEYLTGEKFEGTAAEVLGKVGQAHVSTKLWAKNQVAPPAPVPVVEPPKSPFANDEEAQVAQYTANLIAKTLGYPDAQTMQRALGNIQDNTTDYASSLVTLQFQTKQPDYNPTPENTQKLLGVILQSGITDEEFSAKTRDQQVMLMQQAHTYCLATGQYQPKPAGAAPTRIPPPPPPPPSGRTPTSAEALPENLRATINDKPEEILAKMRAAIAAGYA